MNQCHLSQLVEQAYGAQSCKKKIITWTYVYPNWWRNLILKHGKKWSFSCKTKASMSFIPMKGIYLWFQSWNKRRLLHESIFILIDRLNLILKNDRKWSFSYETKALIHLSEWGEWVYCAQSWKEMRLLCESMFILIDDEL